MKQHLQTRRLTGAPVPGGAREPRNFYATEEAATLALAKVERLPPVLWEPCCGQGHIAAPLGRLGHRVIATDLVDRGFGRGGIDFLRTTRAAAPALITNPPYGQGQVEAFIVHALAGLRLTWFALFLPWRFYPAYRDGLLDRFKPARLWCFTWRVKTAIGGDFTRRHGLIDFAWYLWLGRRHDAPTVVHRLLREGT